MNRLNSPFYYEKIIDLYRYDSLLSFEPLRSEYFVDYVLDYFLKKKDVNDVILDNMIVCVLMGYNKKLKKKEEDPLYNELWELKRLYEMNENEEEILQKWISKEKLKECLRTPLLYHFFVMILKEV